MKSLLKHYTKILVDHQNRVVFVTEDSGLLQKAAVKFEKSGYRVYHVGAIQPMWLRVYGCSPAYADENRVITALHCTSDEYPYPRPMVELQEITDAGEVVKKADAPLIDYTKLKPCGLLCLLWLFFRFNPERWENKAEIAVYKNAVGELYTPNAVGVLSFGSADGRLAIFSELKPVQPPQQIEYYAFDYKTNRVVKIRTVIRGYLKFIWGDYLWNMPYAFEEYSVIAKPGYSGSIAYIPESQ